MPAPKFNRPLPSDHAVAREAAETRVAADADEKRRREVRLRVAFDWLLQQENGRIVWAHIFNLCGYNKSSLAYFAAGDVAPMKTECKEAQRLIYMDLRKMVASTLLAKAEFEAEFGVVPELQKGEK